VLSYFKNQQPTTIIVFIAFFVGLKFIFLFTGSHPVAHVENLWSEAGVFIPNPIFINFLLAQICLLLQAVAFNFLFHKANYHEGSSMVPALYFVLVSSILPQFNVLSIYVIINFFLLLMFQVLLVIAIKESCKFECFNLGFIGGGLTILNAHFILFLPFLFFILYVIKPFRFNEYLMLFFGIFTPIYIALGVSYLANLDINLAAFALSRFHFFRFQKDVFSACILILTACYLLFSFVSMRGIMYSTGFKRRKNINMLVFLFIGLLVTLLFSGNLDESALSALFIPVSIFLALFMLRIRKKKLGEILNTIFVVAIIVINLIRIFK
jgi:hypothetical protein